MRNFLNKTLIMKKIRLFLPAALLALALTGCGPKDADIQKSLQAKEPATVTVMVEKGVATLSGEVADAASRDAAAQTAEKEKGVKSVVNNITIAAPVVFTPPVIAADDPLSASVRDAVKDYPTVNASVQDGVVTLTGSIERSKLPGLMQTLQSLHPKKVESTQLVKN